MTWATKRKLIYLSIFVAIVIVFVAIPATLVFYRAPTCSDGKQNQAEQGIDCGGPCVNLCQEKELDPITLWKRSFQVGPGAYNVIAYVQNPNVDSVAVQVPYIFRLYNADNVLVAERTGKVNLPANKTLPIFEPNVPSGKQTPTLVTFEFTKKPFWVRGKSVFPDVRVLSRVLTREETTPHLEAVLDNQELYAFTSLPVVAILYDTKGNAVAASRTIVDYLDKQSSVPVVFTWPAPFNAMIAEKEIVPILTQGQQ